MAFMLGAVGAGNAQVRIGIYFLSFLVYLRVVCGAAIGRRSFGLGPVLSNLGSRMSPKSWRSVTFTSTDFRGALRLQALTDYCSARWSADASSCPKETVPKARPVEQLQIWTGVQKYYRSRLKETRRQGDKETRRPGDQQHPPPRRVRETVQA